MEDKVETREMVNELTRVSVSYYRIVSSEGCSLTCDEKNLKTFYLAYNYHS